MDTVFVVIGGVLAATLGAWLADVFRRARPQVIPTSMRRTIDIIPHGSVVSPNAELLTVCIEHPFFDSPPFEGIGKVDERAYVTYLITVQERADEYIRLHIPAITKRAEQLQTRLAADDFDGVAHIWINAQLLWIYAEGGYIREEFTLPPAVGRQNDVPPVSQLPVGDAARVNGTDDEVEWGVSPGGSYFVFLPGFVQAVQFPARQRWGRSEELSRELGRRMAEAFAKSEKPDLVRVFNFLAGVERYLPQLQALGQQLDQELARLTRLSVTALIANTGGTPVSLSQQTCQVELMLDGYTYKAAEDGGTKPHERRGNVTLEMLLLDDDGYPTEPIAVEAGGVCPIRAIYRTPLSEEKLPEGGTMYDLLNTALEGAERTWRLRVHAVLQRKAATSIVSRRLSFQDTNALQADAGPGRISVRRENADGVKRLLDARETELSEARAELSTARSALGEAQKKASQLYSALQQQLLQDEDKGLEAPAASTVLESDGATPVGDGDVAES